MDLLLHQLKICEKLSDAPKKEARPSPSKTKMLDARSDFLVRPSPSKSCRDIKVSIFHGDSESEVRFSPFFR